MGDTIFLFMRHDPLAILNPPRFYVAFARISWADTYGQGHEFNVNNGTLGYRAAIALDFFGKNRTNVGLIQGIRILIPTRRSLKASQLAS